MGCPQFLILLNPTFSLVTRKALCEHFPKWLEGGQKSHVARAVRESTDEAVAVLWCVISWCLSQPVFLCAAGHGLTRLMTSLCAWKKGNTELLPVHRIGSSSNICVIRCIYFTKVQMCLYLSVGSKFLTQYNLYLNINEPPRNTSIVHVNKVNSRIL